jgi:hypothetical protein
MRELLIFTFVIAGIIIGGPSSFAITNQDTEYTPILSTEITKISYLHSSYNLTFFEPRNEAHHLGLGTHLPHYQYMDTTLRFVITKTLEKSFLLYQLYLNEGWRRNAAQTTDEYSSHDITILSYNHLIGPDTMLVAGFVHNKQMLIKSQATKTVVLGIYHRLTPRTVVAIGAGPDISRDLSDFRVTAGFQFSF